MMDLLEFVMYTLGVLAVIELGLRYFLYRSKKQAEYTDSRLETTVADRVIFGYVEEINGTFYIWDVLDSSFVGQGQTMKDFDKLSERVNKKVLVIDGEPSAFEKLMSVDGVEEYRLDVQ